MESLNKNVIMEGIFGSQVIDTSGEILDIAGADISALKEGRALLNTEHISPTDIEDVEKGDKKDEDFKGFQTIVGRVITAKKIFSEKDCSTKRELKAWGQIQKPLIYGTVEIWDNDDAHANAKAAASIAKMLHNADSPYKLGLSVEGQTLKRDGNLLKETVIRNMALTLKPCNRTATIDLVNDGSSSSSSKSMLKTAAVDGTETLSKSIDMGLFTVQGEPKDYGFKDAIGKLKKTLAAGSTNAAPGALTQGAALSSASVAKRLFKVWPKLPSREVIAKAMSKSSPEDVEKVYSLLKNRYMLKYEDEMNELYSHLKKTE